MKWYTPLKVIFYSFLTALIVILALLLVGCAYSDHLSPEKNVLFAYAGLIFPFVLLLNIFLCIYWIIAKKWLLFFLLLAALAICWKPVSIFCPLHVKTNDLPQNDLVKVLSYNVMSFAYKDHTKESPNSIIQYIAESEADIVCLQEYMVSAGPNLMSSHDVAKALPMYPYIAEIFFSSPHHKKVRYGLALLSKFPIVSSEKISFPSTENGSAIHELDIHGKRVTIVNNHLESFRLTAEDRSKYSDIISNIRFEMLDEFRGVVQQKLGQAFRIRAKQAERLAEEIRKSGRSYTIVCGDLNDTPISYTRRTIQGLLKDAYTETGMGLGISYNKNFFYFRIDHIFHSSNMDAYHCRVDSRIKLSDHYPIYCYLKLNTK